MSSEYTEHLPLIIGAQKEKGPNRDFSVKPTTKRYGSHVRRYHLARASQQSEIIVGDELTRRATCRPCCTIFGV